MALITPIIDEITAIDASENNVITYQVSDNPKVTSTEIKIINNTTGSLVYQTTSKSSKYAVPISGGKLSNGTYYAVSVRYYVDNQVSAWSNPVDFYCYSKPTVSVSIKDNDVLEGTSLNVVVTYNQAQKVKMGNAVVSIYDDDDNLISSSGELYNSANAMPVNVAHTFTGLTMGQPYYLIATVETKDGISVETDAIHFMMKSFTTLITSGLSLKENSCDGYIEVDVNVPTTNMSKIGKLIIKRIDYQTNTWVSLCENVVAYEDDLKFTYYDFCIPSGVEQTYALVAVDSKGVETKYVTKTITPHWSQVTISDGKSNHFSLYNVVVYGIITRNIQVGTLLPIGQQFPITIKNSKNNYITSNISAQLMGYKYAKTRKLDRFDVTKQVNDFFDFITDGQPKVITDWNGNIWIVDITNSPQISPNSATGNSYGTTSFDFTEQGKYNSEADLRKLKLVSLN